MIDLHPAGARHAIIWLHGLGDSGAGLAPLVDALDLPARIQLGFLAATTLPLLVALVDIGTRSGVMQPQNASALIGAGVLSVVLFPLVATLMHDRFGTSAASDPAPTPVER